MRCGPVATKPGAQYCWETWLKSAVPSVSSQPQLWLDISLYNRQRQGWKGACSGEHILFWKYHASLFPIPNFFPHKVLFCGQFWNNWFHSKSELNQMSEFPTTRQEFDNLASLSGNNPEWCFSFFFSFPITLDVILSGNEESGFLYSFECFSKHFPKRNKACPQLPVGKGTSSTWTGWDAMCQTLGLYLIKQY